MLGQLLINAGRSREAIPVLLPALQRNDKVTPVFLMTLAQAYANTGDPAKAIELSKTSPAPGAPVRPSQPAGAD